MYNRALMREKLSNLLTEQFGGEPVLLSRKQILAANNVVGGKHPSWLLNEKNKAGRNQYHFPPSSIPATAAVAVNPAPAAPATNSSQNTFTMESNGFSENLVPKVDDLFVPFGNFPTLTRVLKSKLFYPIFVTGLSGNGKTYMVEQACAKTSREVIRVNFTVETDEDDLIGGFRLINGETKFFKGPVINAMEKGAVLLLDEIDLGNPAKIMCLQSILEGSGYFIKKTGEYIEPAEGFTVVATANTKGQGSMDGRFIGTNILNEAFLERFPVTFEQEYPPRKTEVTILTKLAEKLSDDIDTAFLDKLVDWAEVVRNSFYDGAVDEIISTRRLTHIVKAFSIFGNRMKAIEMCTNRFQDETKLAFMDLYKAVDEKAEDEEGIDNPDPFLSTPSGSIKVLAVDEWTNN